MTLKILTRNKYLKINNCNEKKTEWQKSSQLNIKTDSYKYILTDKLQYRISITQIKIKTCKNI